MGQKASVFNAFPYYITLRPDTALFAFGCSVFSPSISQRYPGRLEKIRFRYTGKSVDAILDRLPTAKIISQADHSFEIEAEVYGKGIMMWLLSQGERVEVIAPAHLRDKMRDTLLNMLELYR